MAIEQIHAHNLGVRDRHGIGIARGYSALTNHGLHMTIQSGYSAHLQSEIARTELDRIDAQTVCATGEALIGNDGVYDTAAGATGVKPLQGHRDAGVLGDGKTEIVVTTHALTGNIQIGAKVQWSRNLIIDNKATCRDIGRRVGTAT